MCGIAGHLGPRRLPDDVLRATVDLMKRRGPDDWYSRVSTVKDASSERLLSWADIWQGAVLVSHMLCSRLAIIDPAAPMNRALSRVPFQMAFNGELYNYRELRAQLWPQDEPGEFATDTDTEVMLSALARFGWNALERCEGMWALVLLNALDGTLVLSRDRFGEKPLLYCRDGKDLYYGSEPKFIFSLLGKTLPVNYRRVRRFLVNGYRSLYKERETWFDGVQEVEPGTCVEFKTADDGSLVERSWRYWRPRYEQDERMTYEHAVEGARDKLVRAVSLRLRSDVPLAFCQSGGVDSNALIALAREREPVHGFTIANTDGRYDEAQMLGHAAARFGCGDRKVYRHTWVRPQERDFLAELRKLVAYHDSPVSTITWVVHSYLIEAMREAGYKVVLSGTGADELFAGYYDHHCMWLAQLDLPDSEVARAERSAWEKKVKPYIRNPNLAPKRFADEPNYRGHLTLGWRQRLAMMREPRTLAPWGVWDDYDMSEKGLVADGVRNRMLNEIFHETVPVVLHEDDLNSMYFSVENRSPYLDRELFEFCQTIPTRHLIRGGLTKAVLRDAVRSLVPDEVLDNPRKLGFAASLRELLDLGDPKVRAYLTDDSPVFEHVEREAIVGLLGQSADEQTEKFLFSFISAKAFLEANHG